MGKAFKAYDKFREGLGARDTGRNALVVAVLKANMAADSLAIFVGQFFIPGMPLLYKAASLLAFTGFSISASISFDQWAVRREIDGGASRVSHAVFRLFRKSVIRGLSLRKMDNDLKRDTAAKTLQRFRDDPAGRAEALALVKLNHFASVNTHLRYAAIMAVALLAMPRGFAELAEISTLAGEDFPGRKWMLHPLTRILPGTFSIVYSLAHLDAYVSRKIAEGKKSPAYILCYRLAGKTPVRQLSRRLLNYRLNAIRDIEEGRSLLRWRAAAAAVSYLPGARLRAKLFSGLDYKKMHVTPRVQGWLNEMDYPARLEALQRAANPHVSLLSDEELARPLTLRAWGEAYRDFKKHTRLEDFGFSPSVALRVSSLSAPQGPR
ncbi:MAG TPA: hypothetical protein VHB73_03380 [Alphaproteobacteria bacterium]|nr:hypothetical protein [Alphaproteobacteria bacterium]